MTALRTFAPGSLAGPQSICLSMIVRNEAHVIDRCLDSIAPFITHWAVVDTGSTDGTQEKICERLAGLPGRLIERDWPDRFDTARNWAIDLALECSAEYLMFFDADDELEVFSDPKPLPALGGCAISLRYHRPDAAELPSDRPLFVPTASGGRWCGTVHEQFVTDAPRSPIPGAFRGVVRHDGAASQPGAEAKHRRYQAMLRRAIVHAACPFDFAALARVSAGLGDLDEARRMATEALRSGHPWPPAAQAEVEMLKSSPEKWSWPRTK